MHVSVGKKKLPFNFFLLKGFLGDSRFMDVLLWDKANIFRKLSASH
jgi:hypothetical protein